MRERRAIVIVLDGVGVGAAPDADRYGDAGANTLAHVAEAVGGLALPNLARWGLGHLAAIRGVPRVPAPAAAFGRLQERAAGKDSTTGHWELAGLILTRPFPTYPHGFPPEVIAAFERAIGRRVLGNRPASGTAILAELGEEHLRTGRPIVYTSADSVFQIAAHEAVIPLSELRRMGEIARQLLQGEHAVARVILRPFAGEPGAFYRTPNRHDLALPPPGPTLLDAVVAAGASVWAVGKVAELFAGRGITHARATASNAEGIAAIGEALAAAPPGLVFANLVDFDSLYGHRNDPAGFAAALAEFDRALPDLARRLRRGDLLLLTADHGNDPTTPGTDHTREAVPLLVTGPGLRTGVDLGVRETFADVAATIAEWLGVAWSGSGRSFLAALTN